MLLRRNILTQLQIKVAHNIIHLVNFNPTKANESHTLCKVLMGTKLDLNKVRIFGWLCFVGKDNTQYHRLEVQSKQKLYLSIDSMSKEYYIFLSNYKKILITKNFYIDEDKFLTSFSNNSNLDTFDFITAFFNE